MHRTFQSILLAAGLLYSSGFRRHASRPLSIGRARRHPLLALDTNVDPEDRPVVGDPLDGVEGLSEGNEALREVVQRTQPAADPIADAELDSEAPPAVEDPLDGFDDLSGDRGVLRKVIQSARPGADVLVDRDIVIVDYEGFEHPGDRKLFSGEDLSVVIGDGTMIRGWDIGLAGMGAGSEYELLVTPEYAYGEIGVPPVLSGLSSLRFHMTVKEKKGNSQAVRIFTDMDPLLPRTPDSIRASYAKRQEERRLELEEQLGDGLVDKVRRWLGSLYIFGFFSEDAPWYLNPLITFPSIFASVALASYVLWTSGAVTLTRESTAVPAIEKTRQSSTIDDIEDD